MGVVASVSGYNLHFHARFPSAFGLAFRVLNKKPLEKDVILTL